MTDTSNEIESVSGTSNAENSRLWRMHQKEILGEEVFNAKEAKRKMDER